MHDDGSAIPTVPCVGVDLKLTEAYQTAGEGKTYSPADYDEFLADDDKGEPELFWCDVDDCDAIDSVPVINNPVTPEPQEELAKAFES
jgi:hypothetical protein